MILLDSSRDLDLPIYISDISLYDFPLGQELVDIDLPNYIQCFPFWWTITSNDTSLYSIVLF